MNINYINESVISVAVMRRNHTHTLRVYTHTHKHTRTHAEPTGRVQRGEDVCCVSTKLGLLRVHRCETGK